MWMNAWMYGKSEYLETKLIINEWVWSKNDGEGAKIEPRIRSLRCTMTDAEIGAHLS